MVVELFHTAFPVVVAVEEPGVAVTGIFSWLLWSIVVVALL